jgi:hypothetical protein
MGFYILGIWGFRWGICGGRPETVDRGSGSWTVAKIPRLGWGGVAPVPHCLGVARLQQRVAYLLRRAA